MNLSDLEKLKSAYEALPPGKWDFCIADNAETPHVTVDHVSPDGDGVTILTGGLVQEDAVIFIAKAHSMMAELLRIAEEALRDNDYVERVIQLYKSGQGNVYEVYKGAYGDSHEQGVDETDLDFICRCAEQDFADGETGGAIYQELYDEITGPSVQQTHSLEY